MVPDVLLTAKGLGNGFPISGIITRGEVAGRMRKGSVGGTYAGNAVSCAAAVEVVKTFEREGVLANVKEREGELFEALRAVQADKDTKGLIWDVRGKGLMVAVEFARNERGREGVPKDLAKRVAQRCIDKGLLILTTSVFEVIRFIPPLNITKEDMAKGCKIFAEAVREVVREG